MRRLIAAALTVVYASAASADPRTHCNGKYAETAELVDAAMGKYGTLYSGGDHWHQLDNVGATIDLYRFWKGYPDLRLRDFSRAMRAMRDSDDLPYGWNFVSMAEQAWEKARWALAPDAPADAPAEDRVWAGWGFDTLTSAGPAPDWWQRPDAFENLTEWQRWVAEKAKSEPFLDWLQTVLAASNAPWANKWHIADLMVMDREMAAAYDRLATAALKRYEAGDSIEWLAAAAINAGGPSYRSPLVNALDNIEKAIETCKASPPEYAAFAIGVGARDRGRYRWATVPDSAFYPHLPNSIRQTLAGNRLYRRVINRLNSGRSFEDGKAELAAFRAVAPDDEQWQQNVDVAQLYAAETFEYVPLSNNAYVRRAYNLLSADNITILARRDDPDGSLTRAAFARHIALGHWKKAETLLPELMAHAPDHADTMKRLWKSAYDRKVRLTLIALHTPGITPLISGGNGHGDVGLYYRFADVLGWRSLPLEYVNGGVLQRDFEVWLRLPQRWGAFWSMRGVTIGWIERLVHERGHRFPNVAVRRLLPDGPGWAIGFRKLIAWDELGLLAVGTPLMQTVSRVIVPWADDRTDTWWKRKLFDHDMEAQALGRLIHLCKYNSCGEIGGHPAQQRAFKLLHYRMRETKAARETKYWWKGR